MNAQKEGWGMGMSANHPCPPSRDSIHDTCAPQVFPFANLDRWFHNCILFKAEIARSGNSRGMHRENAVPLWNLSWKLWPSLDGEGVRSRLYSHVPPVTHSLLRKHRFPLLCFLLALCLSLSTSSTSAGSFCLLFMKVLMCLESFHLKHISLEKQNKYLVYWIHSILSIIYK